MFNIPRRANFGCGPLPLYPQDALYMKVDPIQPMEKTAEEWLLIDKFIAGPLISNWDIEVLDEIPDNYLEEIYCSHALEHIAHRRVEEVLTLWYQKLAKDGTICINVPDLMYAFNQLRKLESDDIPDGLYDTYYGLHGVMSIIYGTQSQPGEYHLGGFTIGSLTYLLEKVGFSNVNVKEVYDDHQMGVLIANAKK